MAEVADFHLFLLDKSVNMSMPDSTAEIGFSSSPSGREVLTAKAEKVIAEYNKCVEEDEYKIEMAKKAVKDMADMVIKNLEEEMYKKQMKMNENMQEILTNINTKLETLEGQEEELKNFSAGLAMFMGDLKVDLRR